jgi:signal transduction histidine kinase/ligand-binding sensor domain-containing protein
MTPPDNAFRLAVGLIFLSALELYGPALGQGLPFHNYSTRDGLPSDHITALCQDSKGFLWIGTSEGLSLYDGTTFRTFTTLDGLANNFITSLIESRESPGTVWIGSIANGITRYRDDKFTAFGFARPAAKTFIGTIVEDREGTIWVTTSAGVFNLANDTLRAVPIHPPQAIIGSDVAVAPDGRIWFGVNHRLYIYSPREQKTTVQDLDMKPDASINHMSVDREGDMWISGNDGSLRRFIGDRLVNSWQNESKSYIDQVALDRAGDLWLTGSGGLLRMRKAGFPNTAPTTYAESNGLQERSFEPILEDREGNIWFGGVSTGLYKLAEKNVVKLHLKNGTAGFTDRAGHLWLPHSQGIWECRKDSLGIWSTTSHNLVHGTAVVQFGWGGADSYVEEKIWFRISDSLLECDTILANEHGFSRLKEVGAFGPGRGLHIASPLTFYIDKRKYLWLSLDTGIGVYNLGVTPPEFLTILRLEDELRVSSIRAIHRDSRGNVWFGSFSEGLVELVDGDLSRRELKHLTTADGLADNGVRSFADDDSGRLWIGTRYGGAAIFDGARFQTVSIKQGLPSNTVWAIAKDDRHRMWLGTGAGAIAVDANNLEDLSWPDVMAREPVGVCYSGVTKTVWILTTEDAIALGDESTKVVAPPVYIARVTVNDRLLGRGDGTEFPHDQNNFVVEFVAPSFKNEQAVKYQFRLQGVDSTWSLPSRQRLVTYAALSPGSYTFQAVALNGDQIKSTVPASFSFMVLSPVWLRWWFIVSAGAVFGFLGYWVVRRKVTSLEQRRKMQEEFSRRLIESQENERTRIAAELHDSLGQNLLAIQNHTVLALDATPDNPEIVNRLNDISGVATRTIAEVREIAHNLRPYHLDTLGLTTSMQSIVRRMAESTGITFASDIDPIDNLVSKEDEIHIYRILQEAVSNIVKHSNAKSAVVFVKHKGSTVMITISDDGKGFIPQGDEARPGNTHGFGLKGMRERVRILGGSMNVQSNPEEGTGIVIEIPLRGTADAR